MDGEDAWAQCKEEPDRADEGGDVVDEDYSQFDYCLFIWGRSLRSQKSIKTVRSVCDKYARNGYKLDIVDVFDDPRRAESEKVFVTPTLIRYRPSPSRRIVGDFTSEAVLAAKMEFTD